MHLNIQIEPRKKNKIIIIFLYSIFKPNLSNTFFYYYYYYLIINADQIYGTTRPNSFFQPFHINKFSIVNRALGQDSQTDATVMTFKKDYFNVTVCLL